MHGYYPAADRPPVLSGQEFKADPYPAYAWLREHRARLLPRQRRRRGAHVVSYPL